MDKAKIQFLVSVLINSEMYLRMPVRERMSFLSRLAKSYPFLFSLVEHNWDADHELSWLEILSAGEEID